MRCWESPGDLPRVIEICLFASGAQRIEAESVVILIELFKIGLICELSFVSDILKLCLIVCFGLLSIFK